MSYVKERFATRLKELRDAAGLTQEQLAKELKVSRGAISYYEKGERTPDIEFLDSVCLFFNLPIDYVLGYTENINKEYINMYEMFGLTDNACSVLDESDGYLGHIISHIITNNDFEGIEELFISIIKNYKSFNSLDIDYLSFILTKHIMHLISNALRSELNLQYTDQEKEELYNTIECLLSSNNKALSHLKEVETKISQEIEKNSEDRKNNLHNSTSYKARKSVHSRLLDATSFLKKDI